MLLLIFSGLIVLAELCAISCHETRRNRRPLNYLELQDYWYHQEQRESAEDILTTAFPTPAAVDSEEVLDSLALLKNPGSAGRWADLGDRLM